VFGFGKVSKNNAGDNGQSQRETQLLTDAFSPYTRRIISDSVVPETTEVGMLIAGALGLCQFFGSLE
jgi:hypothetical protein